MAAIHSVDAAVRLSTSRQSAAVLLAAIAVFALQTGARAVADDAPGLEQPSQPRDHVERLYTEKIRIFSDLMKRDRSEEAGILALQLQLLEPENPANEAMAIVVGQAAHAGRQQLDARLAHRIVSVDQVCRLTIEEEKRLRLAGRGDIKRFCNRADSTLLSSLFERGSMFDKVLKTTLTPEQMAAYNEAARWSIDGSVVRFVDPVFKKVWIGLGEADGLKPRTIFVVRKKLRVEHDPGELGDEFGDEGIKGTIEILRVLEKNLSEATVLEETIDDPIAKGDPIVPQRQTAQ